MSGLHLHLQPLRTTVAGSGPSVGLALLVQAGVVRVPGERLDAPRAEGAGGRHLGVSDQTGLDAQGLGATCHV